MTRNTRGRDGDGDGDDDGYACMHISVFLCFAHLCARNVSRIDMDIGNPGCVFVFVRARAGYGMYWYTKHVYIDVLTG